MCLAIIVLSLWFWHKECQMFNFWGAPDSYFKIENAVLPHSLLLAAVKLILLCIGNGLVIPFMCNVVKPVSAI